MDRFLQDIKQTIVLWLNAKYDRVLFYLINPHLLIYRNRTKIIASFLVFLLYKLNTEWVHYIEFSNPNDCILIEHLSVHSIFALILFIFFERKISELVGLGIGSKDKFYADDFFDKIRQSNFRIRILETFTKEILDKGNKEKLKKVIISFLINAKRKRNKPQIQILLLDPNSDYAELRIKQLLKTELEDPITIQEEKNRWLSWLVDWVEIRQDVEKFAKQKLKYNLDFKIYIYDTSPQNSIYSCDNFAYIGPYIEGVKTTQVEQAIVNLEKPINRDYMLTFEDLLDVSSEHTNSPTRELQEYLEFPYNIKNIKAVKTFVSLARMTDESVIERILTTELDPKKLEEYELLGLVKYLEQNHYAKTTDKKHFNIFGTGGDQNKTINISTMAAILASHYNDIIVVNKSGTLEVSSNVGSETFYNRLCRELREMNNNTKYFNFNAKNDSKYVHLSKYRYEYTDQIRNVRNKIWKEGKHLDIFKIIFPISNLSKNSGQVNGVSNLDYLEFYRNIYQKLHKRGIIVFNTRGSDELLEGENKIFINLSNNLEIQKDFPLKKTISEEEEEIYWNYYSESSVEFHIKKFLNFFSQPDYIQWTMAYNVALILRLQYDEEIEVLADKVFKWFKTIKTD